MASSLIDLEQLKAQMREIESPTQGTATEASIEEEAARAFKKILKLASIKEQATEKLRARLLRDGFPEAAVESALERAVACRIVDDERYAESFVRMRIAQGRGRRGVERELEELAILVPDEEVWNEALERTGSEDELDRALALLERKPPRSKNLREGAYRKLVQKGYSADIAASASRKWVESRY